jgi:DNA-binding NarL/FixJ family response regulator
VLLVNGSRLEYAAALSAAGFDVVPTASVREALRSSHVRRPELLIVELELPQQNLAQVQKLFPGPPGSSAMAVLLLGDAAMENAARHVGATFCPSPCPPETLVDTVRRTIAGRAPRDS